MLVEAKYLVRGEGHVRLHPLAAEQPLADLPALLHWTRRKLERQKKAMSSNGRT